MKKLALTLAYQNEDTKTHIIERIEADTMVELMARLLLMSHVVNQAIKEDERKLRFLQDHSDDIPF